MATPCSSRTELPSRRLPYGTGLYGRVQGEPWVTSHFLSTAVRTAPATSPQRALTGGIRLAKFGSGMVRVELLFGNFQTFWTVPFNSGGSDSFSLELLELCSSSGGDFLHFPAVFLFWTKQLRFCSYRKAHTVLDHWQ